MLGSWRKNSLGCALLDNHSGFTPQQAAKTRSSLIPCWTTIGGRGLHWRIVKLCRAGLNWHMSTWPPGSRQKFTLTFSYCIPESLSIFSFQPEAELSHAPGTPARSSGCRYSHETWVPCCFCNSSFLARSPTLSSALGSAVPKPGPITKRNITHKGD